VSRQPGSSPPVPPSRPDEAPEFDLLGPLPTGLTLLEASAGTGKTYAITTLAARFVAEGLPLDRMLLITFTRMATGELRERVRERLVSAAEQLGGALGGGRTDDPLVTYLAKGPAGDVSERQARLARAVGDFDAATIETTHGFCLQMLSGLGVAGDVDRDVTLVEDVTDLMEEVVDDLYVRRFWTRPDDLHFHRSEATVIADAVVRNPGALIAPRLTDHRDAKGIRRRFARTVMEEIDARKRHNRILTYDDVLTRLRDTLADPVRGPEACSRLRSRYDVVLVDEFQDTDPVQWEILRLAFAAAGTTLVLIGDPKQAIYAFRGADVYAYLEAARTAASRSTLGVNWRSDHALITAYDALFADSQLGHPGITYRRVRAAPGNVEPRLLGGPKPAALRVRVLHRADNLVGLTNHGYARAQSARDTIARDLAADAVGLLSSGAEIVRRQADGSGERRQPLRPGEVAVLVRTNRQAAVVRDALHDAGLPAVVAGSGSVFATEPARQWRVLLETLERPTSRDRAAAAALTAFVGWSPEQVASAGEPVWEDHHWRLQRWAAVLCDQGVAALVHHLDASTSLSSRVLALTSGERFMTDLSHVAQLMHAAATSDGLGAGALTAWLRRRISEADRDTDDEDRSRRLESDAEAVQVLTIHRSKGLEFPVVYCPYPWDHNTQEPKVPVFHDPANDDRRTIDVGREGPEFELHKQLDIVEGRGEDLRLLYVALTRARHRAVIWWAGAMGAQHSALGRILFARSGDGVVDAFGHRRLAPDDEVERRLTDLGGGIVVERVRPLAGVKWEQPARPTPRLEIASLGRSLDPDWRRASYSSITNAVHEHGVSSEPGDTVVSDEQIPVPALDSGSDGRGSSGVPVVLAGMPSGARIGTMVHEVLRKTDFAAPNLEVELAANLQSELAWTALDVGDPADVVAGLAAFVRTPLGALVGGVRLADVPRADRLDELSFELPLIGGDRPDGQLSVSDLAGLLESALPGQDPLVRYAARLREPALQAALRGYLTGSLDLVFRLPGPRFVVVDYKTNRLSVAEETLTAWHYRPEAVTAAMEAAHYPLQALLYTIALHRYLRWRVPGYDPGEHLCGVLYLFVRGISPEHRPVDGQPPGVWSWRPPASLVEGLSDLFDEGRSG
jgi:exodeoxyribonuclease V beta subunit